MEKRNNKPQYPPAPTPDELKKHSKKYIFILVGVIVVLIIGALVLITYPKEEVVVPKAPVAPVIEALQMYDTKVCAGMDAVFNCITETNVFTAREVSISYRLKGYRSEIKASPHQNVEKYFFNLQDEYVVLLQKEIQIFDASGNNVGYTQPGFSPIITMPIRFKQGTPVYLFSGETFNFDKLTSGNYYVEVGITDMFANKKTTERFAFTLQ